MSADLPLALRPMESGDRSFVIDSWLRSYRESAFARRIPHDVYYSRFGHSGLVEEIVDRAGQVVVACLPEKPTFLYGWIACSQPGAAPLLHYLYVKQDFRPAGIAARLFALLAPTDPLRITHDLPVLGTLTKTPIEFVNPYRMRSA